MTTKERLMEVDSAVQRLAAGNTSDHDSLSRVEYKELEDLCVELACFLDNIADSFRIAAD